MHNKTLLKISIILFSIGIFTLLVLSKMQEAKQENIADIKDNLLNQKIKIQGQVTQIKSYPDFQIITIQDSTGKINTLINHPINLTKNQTLIVEGKVTEYKGQLQINADKVIVPSLNFPNSF